MIPFPFAGIAPRVIYSEHLVEQYRFPKSKKKRIRTKWACRQRNYRPRRDGFKLPNGTLVFHPVMRQRIEAAIGQAL